MGCSQSTAVVPTAQDFYYRPSYRSMRQLIHENVLPIDAPGMCYGFSMNEKNSWVSKRTGLSCQGFTDTQEGVACLDGLQLTGPTESGQMFLRDAHRNIVAILKPIVHEHCQTSFEIQCPKPYMQACPQPDKSCFQRNKNKANESKEAEEWYTWATVVREPHSLTYDLTLVADKAECVYKLQYCGGPATMRVDKDGQLRALVQNRRGAWDIVVGAGVDPSLMLCFAAIVNQGACPVRAGMR